MKFCPFIKFLFVPVMYFYQSSQEVLQDCEYQDTHGLLSRSFMYPVVDYLSYLFTCLEDNINLCSYVEMVINCLVRPTLVISIHCTCRDSQTSSTVTYLMGQFPVVLRIRRVPVYLIGTSIYYMTRYFIRYVNFFITFSMFYTRV